VLDMERPRVVPVVSNAKPMVVSDHVIVESDDGLIFGPYPCHLRIREGRIT